MAENKVIVEEKYCKKYQCTWICKIPREGWVIGRRTTSPKFPTGQHEWDIEVYFGGYDDNSKDYISVRVYPYSEEIGIAANFKDTAIKLSIINKDNREGMEQIVILTRENRRNVQFVKFLKRDDLLNSPDLQSNNQLKLMCRISFINQVSQSETQRATLLCRNPQISIYEKMFDNPEFSDFQFVVGDTRIKVHKCILAAHSPVFAAMFQSDMIEKNKNEVDIEDIDADVMRQLLRFTYVGDVQDINDFADKLFIAADKYELNGLKVLCEEKLMKKLTIDNLYETLLFVDNYDTTKLKDAAIEFIICNSEKLSPMEEFKKSMKNLSSMLLAEVISAFLAKPK